MPENPCQATALWAQFNRSNARCDVHREKDEVARLLSIQKVGPSSGCKSVTSGMLNIAHHVACIHGDACKLSSHRRQSRQTEINTLLFLHFSCSLTGLFLFTKITLQGICYGGVTGLCLLDYFSVCGGTIQHDSETRDR